MSPSSGRDAASPPSGVGEGQAVAALEGGRSVLAAAEAQRSVSPLPLAPLRPPRLGNEPHRLSGSRLGLASQLPATPLVQDGRSRFESCFAAGWQSFLRHAARLLQQLELWWQEGILDATTVPDEEMVVWEGWGPAPIRWTPSWSPDQVELCGDAGVLSEESVDDEESAMLAIAPAPGELRATTSASVDEGLINDYGIPEAYFDLFSLGILCEPVRMLVLNPDDQSVSVSTRRHSLAQLLRDVTAVLGEVGHVGSRQLLEPGTRNLIIGVQLDTSFDRKIGQWVARLVARSGEIFQRYAEEHQLDRPTQAHLWECLREWVPCSRSHVRGRFETARYLVRVHAGLFFVPNQVAENVHRGGLNAAQRVRFGNPFGPCAKAIWRQRLGLEVALGELWRNIEAWQEGRGCAAAVNAPAREAFAARAGLLQEIAQQAVVVRQQHSHQPTPVHLPPLPI